MPRYIRINTLKLTFAEDLRMAKSWKVIFLWGAKLFRKRLDFGSGLPIASPFEEFALSAESMPPDVLDRMAEPLNVAAAAGFTPLLFQRIVTLAGETTIYAANCRSANGEIVARVMYIRMGKFTPPQERVVVTLSSCLADGRRLNTTSQAPSFDSLPHILTQRQEGASFNQLLGMHQTRLDELRSQTAPEIVPDDVALARFVDRLETESLEVNLRRGLYEEIPHDEVQRQATEAAVVRSLAGDNETDNAVLAEIQKQQSRKGSWKSGLAFGVVTLLAFIGIGGAKWNWQFIAILTGVIAFHEFGHYVAMRLFRYQDLRMFFVPLLGAAVTGRHYNVKGWQRALVSLAGPLPGIAVGVVLLPIGMFTHNPLIIRIALILFLVNGINLLPFPPLDGGWVMHALIFSRHFVLESVFLGLAGVALVAATMLGEGKLWIWLGFAILIGLPASFQAARVASKLRARGLPVVSPDEQNIPPETALAILAELKTNTQIKRLPKQFATQVLNIFQKLNATPPGVLATLGLLALYLGASGVAFVGTGVAMIARDRNNNFSDLFENPKYPLDPHRITMVGPLESTNWLAPSVIANFKTPSAAGAAFDTARRDLKPGQRLTLLGQSLILSGTAQIPPWLNRAKAEVFVDQPASNAAAVVVLSCRAPDASTASNIVAVGDHLVTGTGAYLWPPWVKLDRFDPARRAAITSFRHTWDQIQGAMDRARGNPEYVAAREEDKDVSDPAEQRERYQQRADLLRTLTQREFSKLEATNDPALDKELVRLYARFNATEDSDDESALAELTASDAWRLGVVPSLRDAGDLPQAAQAMSYGFFDAEGDTVEFLDLEFYRVDHGLPALIEWLRSQGCTDFKYRLTSADSEDSKEPAQRGDSDDS